MEISTKPKRRRKAEKKNRSASEGNASASPGKKKKKKLDSEASETSTDSDDEVLASNFKEKGKTKPSQAATAETGFWGTHLPFEVLIRIYQHVVNTEGALPFLCRAARVCSFWHEASCQTSLWSNVDLSYGWIKSTQASLRWLCDNRFSRLQSMNVSGWGQALKNSGLQILSNSCPWLQAINLSYCV